MIESFTVDSQPRPTPVTERGLRLMTMAEDAKRRNLSAKVMTTALVVSLVAGTVGIDVAASRLSSEGRAYGPIGTGERSHQCTTAGRIRIVVATPIGHGKVWTGGGGFG